MPNRYKPMSNPEANLLRRYEDSKARLQKIKDSGYKIISIWVCEFRKLLPENPDLKIELCLHPYVKYSPTNFLRCLVWGEEQRPQKHITELSRGIKSITWMLSVCIPTCVRVVSYVWVTREFIWVQTLPRTVF